MQLGGNFPMLQVSAGERNAPVTMKSLHANRWPLLSGCRSQDRCFGANDDLPGSSSKGDVEVGGGHLFGVEDDCNIGPQSFEE